MKKLYFISLAIAVSLLAACGHKHEEKIKDFAAKFGDFINTNQKDSIQKYYPDFILTDSLASVPLSNISIITEASEGIYRIEYSPEQLIVIAYNEDGDIKVEVSKGMLSFSSAQIELLEKEGLYDKTLSDVEISELITKELKKLDSFTSPDLDLFNLHGPVKEMTISYDSSSGSPESCFYAWSWEGNYKFDESGAWTNYKQIFEGGVKRNNNGQIVELYYSPDNPDFGSPFVYYQWKNNHVIKFEAGTPTGNYSSQDGTLTYDANGNISGENMDMANPFWEGKSKLKLQGFKFDQFGNWISCSWTKTVIGEESDYWSCNSLNPLPEWLKNATASLEAGGMRDLYAMESEESGGTRETRETTSGTITRVINYYYSK